MGFRPIAVVRRPLRRNHVVARRVREPVGQGRHAAEPRAAGPQGPAPHANARVHAAQPEPAAVQHAHAAAGVRSVSQAAASYVRPSVSVFPLISAGFVPVHLEPC